MADQEVGLRIKTDGTDAVKTVGNIKKELREAQQAAVSLAQKFGDTSNEAFAAAKKVALLKDQIQDTKDRIDLFNPGKKFAALGGALQTVAGGFSAITGAVALFGVESKEVEKTLLKVQSALAITQGINTIVDAGDAMRNFAKITGLTAVAQKVFSVSTVASTAILKAFGISVTATSVELKVLRTALITTGIGALVIGVGFLIEKLSSLSNETDSAADAQDRLAASTKRANEAFSEQSDFINRDIQLKIKRAKAAGASEAEITKLERDGILERIELSKKAIDEGIKNGQDIKTFAAANLKEIQALEDYDLDLQIKRSEAKKNVKREEIKSIQEIEDLANAERQKRNDALNAEQDAKGKVTGATGAVKNAVELRKEEIEAQLEAEEDFTNRNIALVARGAATIAGINKDASDSNIASLQAEKAAREIVTQSAIGSLGLIADLVGRSTAAGKVLALAEIAAGTAVGFINALRIAQQTAAATGPGAAFAFPIFYATQLTAVLGAAARAKSILSSGKSGGNASAPQGTGATSAPQIPRQNITGQTSLDQNSLNQIGNATSRAYVLESDVTNNQERITRLNRAARLN